MKKLIAVLLSLIFILSLSACGGGDAGTNSDANSDTTSSEEEALPDGYQVNYTSVGKGYFHHTSIWNADIVGFNGFECMDQEYLYLPVGTTVMCNEKFAVYCYELRDNKYMVLDEKATEELGQTIVPAVDVQLQTGTYVINSETYVRFVVKGSLSDIKLYVPLEKEDQVKIGTLEDFLK